MRVDIRPFCNVFTVMAFIALTAFFVVVGHSKASDIEESFQSLRSAIQQANFGRPENREQANLLVSKIQSSPREIGSYRVLGKMLVTEDFPKLAIKTYDVGLHHVPTNIPLRLLKASALQIVEGGQSLKILAVLRDAYRISPQNSAVNLRLGYFYSSLGDDSNARDYLNRVLNLPGLPRHKASAHLGLAKEYRRAGDKRRETRHMKQVLKIDPSLDNWLREARKSGDIFKQTPSPIFGGARHTEGAGTHPKYDTRIANVQKTIESARLPDSRSSRMIQQLEPGLSFDQGFPLPARTLWKRLVTKISRPGVSIVTQDPASRFVSFFMRDEADGKNRFYNVYIDGGSSAYSSSVYVTVWGRRSIQAGPVYKRFHRFLTAEGQP